MSGAPPTAARAGDDAEIVAQSAERPELFAPLYDRYAPDIHRYAARRLGDGAADDSPTLECARGGPIADTFLAAFREGRGGQGRRTRLTRRPGRAAGPVRVVP